VRGVFGGVRFAGCFSLQNEHHQRTPPITHFFNHNFLTCNITCSNLYWTISIKYYKSI